MDEWIITYTRVNLIGKGVKVLKYLKGFEVIERSKMIKVDYTIYHLKGGQKWNLRSFYFYNPILQCL